MISPRWIEPILRIFGKRLNPQSTELSIRVHEKLSQISDEEFVRRGDMQGALLDITARVAEANPQLMEVDNDGSVSGALLCEHVMRRLEGWQRLLLQLHLEGLSFKQIAERYNLDEQKVLREMTLIYSKLSVIARRAGFRVVAVKSPPRPANPEQAT